MSQYNQLGLYDDRMKQKSFYDDALYSDNYSDMKLPGFTNVEEEFDIKDLIRKVDPSSLEFSGDIQYVDPSSPEFGGDIEFEDIQDTKLDDLADGGLAGIWPR